MTFLPTGHAQYTHPKNVLKGYFQLAAIHGAEKFMRSPNFKKEREFFVAACFAYGLRRIFRKEWYIGAGDEPPDFMVGSSSDRSEHERPCDVISCELVTIPPLVDDAEDREVYVREILDKKLGPLYLPGPQTWLLVCVNSKDAYSIIRQIREMMAAQQKYSSVWTLNFCTTDKLGFGFEIMEILPGTLASGPCGLRDEFERGEVYQSDFVQKLKQQQSLPS